MYDKKRKRCGTANSAQLKDDDDNDHHLSYSPTHCTLDQGGDALELKSTTAA